MNEAWVVRCRGLPYSVTKKDVETFLNTSTLASTTDESIHITYNIEGRPSGECFVMLDGEESYYNALRKNNEYLKSRYIEVFESDWHDLNKSLEKSGVNRQSYGRKESPIVKLRGLPFRVTEEQIYEFFSGLQIVSLKILKKETGEATGEGYVRFSRQDEATAALELHMNKLGHRYIEIFKGSDREMQEEKPLKREGYEKPVNQQIYTECEHKVLMRGLPFTASQGDVIKFFSPLLPRHIELIWGEDGRPSGTAYAFFNSHDDVMVAMEKDKEMMGTRYVELFMDSKPTNKSVSDKQSGGSHDIGSHDQLLPDGTSASQRAAELIAQAHGLSGGGASDGMQPPSTPATDAPATDAAIAPVRKKLMAGAARPISEHCNGDHRGKRRKVNGPWEKNQPKSKLLLAEDWDVSRGTSRGARRSLSRGVSRGVPRGRGRHPPLPTGTGPRMLGTRGTQKRVSIRGGARRMPVNMMVSYTTEHTYSDPYSQSSYSDQFYGDPNVAAAVGYYGGPNAVAGYAYGNQTVEYQDPHSYTSATDPEATNTQSDPNSVVSYSDPYSSTSQDTPTLQEDQYAGFNSDAQYKDFFSQGAFTNTYNKT